MMQPDTHRTLVVFAAYKDEVMRGSLPVTVS